MAIDFNNFKTTTVPNYQKIKGGISSLSSAPSANEQLEVIVRVNAQNYVPGRVDLRNRLSPYLFTATTQLAQLQELDNDPQVASISLSQKLRTID